MQEYNPNRRHVKGKDNIILYMYALSKDLGMRFQMQSTNLLKITPTNVNVFRGIGHFRKSTCFDICILSCLR